MTTLSPPKPVPLRRSKRGDAITLLEEEHAEARDRLFMLMHSAVGMNRDRMVRAMAEDLWIAMQIEEEILYPSLPRMGTVGSFAPLTRPALCAALRKLELSRSNAGADVRALAREVYDLHEADCDDEQRNVFPHARRALTAPELTALGERLRVRRQQLRESGDIRRPHPG